MFGAGVCPACGQHVRQGEVVHTSSCIVRAPAPVVERLRRRDAAASHSQTAVAAAETLRRHIRTLLLRQQRRCGVALADCCCGSRDVAASHLQTAVAAAVTLRRHTLRLLLRQQRRCGVTLAYRCCGSRDVAASGISAEAAVEPAYFAMVGGKMVQPGQPGQAPVQLKPLNAWGQRGCRLLVRTAFNRWSDLCRVCSTDAAMRVASVLALNTD